MKFYDRINELSILQENEQQSYNSAVFTVLMGRRRVGKTSLITKSLEGKEYAYLFVSKDSEALLCQNFQRDLEQQIGLTIYGEVTRFKDLFEVIMKEAQRRHLTIVFDEFQTLYKINPAIFSDIQNVWDKYKGDAKINLIVLGSGDQRYENMFRYFSSKYPNKISAKIGYDEELSHLIYAGCDAFLVPSAFEPCGLTQLIALRYGSLPIVHEIGGLKDTVKPYNQYEGTGTGFSFQGYSSSELLDRINHAEWLYRENTEEWKAMEKRAMKEDWSWNNSSKKYENLYDSL